jgi:hypothetical protein
MMRTHQEDILMVLPILYAALQATNPRPWLRLSDTLALTEEVIAEMKDRRIVASNIVAACERVAEEVESGRCLWGEANRKKQ